MRKRIVRLTVAALLLMTVCACGTQRTEEKAEAVTLRLTNEVKDRIAVLSVAWYLNGEALGVSGVEVAGGGMLGAGPFSFRYEKNAENATTDLSGLTARVSVTADGETVQAGEMRMPSGFGSVTGCRLVWADRCYALQECPE